MTEGTLVQEEREQAVARANAYQVLARAFSPPSDWPPSFAKELRDGLLPLAGELEPQAIKLAVEAEESIGRRDAVSVAHARLFVGPFEVQAAPWASLYLDPSQQLMGEASQYAAKAYSEAGLGPSEGRPKDAPDHVTHELEFMYFLAFQAATTGDSVWRDRQEGFWTEHLGRWLPELARAMRRARSDPFYSALADFLLVFAETEGAVLREPGGGPRGRRVEPPCHLENEQQGESR